MSRSKRYNRRGIIFRSYSVLWSRHRGHRYHVFYKGGEFQVSEKIRNFTLNKALGHTWDPIREKSCRMVLRMLILTQ